MCLDAGSKRSVAMPSQAVDVVWHEFILFTRAYDNFCKKSFGNFLHHTPAEAMSSPQNAQIGIKNAWKLACKRANIQPLSPAYLPALFAIDDIYNIPNGFCYSLNCSNVSFYTKTSHKQQSSSDVVFCATHIGCGSGCGGGFSLFSDGDGGSFSFFGDSDGGGGSCSGGCGGGCGS
ncbi:MAG: hypothetical protein KGV50_01090 [Gammaproteobacteria bacterium]|nr:hypothetical protein [Gammaproteobacteria bacterium]